MIITGMAHFESVAQKRNLLNGTTRTDRRYRLTEAMYLWFGPVKHSRITSV